MFIAVDGSAVRKIGSLCHRRQTQPARHVAAEKPRQEVRPESQRLSGNGRHLGTGSQSGEFPTGVKVHQVMGEE